MPNTLYCLTPNTYTDDTLALLLQEMSQKSMEEDADPRWRVGNHYISVDHLELVGLQHVSMGSWQVHIRYEPPCRDLSALFIPLFPSSPPFSQLIRFGTNFPTLTPSYFRTSSTSTHDLT